MGACRQERVCREGKDESLGLLPAGATPWQGQAGDVPLAGQLGTAGLCRSTPPMSTPSSARGFLSHVLPFIMLLSVAVGAEDKSGLDLFCPH